MCGWHVVVCHQVKCISCQDLCPQEPGHAPPVCIHPCPPCPEPLGGPLLRVGPTPHMTAQLGGRQPGESSRRHAGQRALGRPSPCRHLTLASGLQNSENRFRLVEPPSVGIASWQLKLTRPQCLEVFHWPLHPGSVLPPHHTPPHPPLLSSEALHCLSTPRLLASC